MIGLINLLPRRWIRFCGQLQFKVPILRRPMAWLARRVAARAGVIQSGLGRGLRFDATGGYPGYLLGTSEVKEQTLLGRMLRPGAVFYDIGANIGFYSTLAARLVGEQGKVIAFEPFPVSAEACRANAKRNNFAQVMVVQAAVGSEKGTANLSLGSSSAAHRLDSQGGLEVPVLAIDDWREQAGAPQPDVVMMDIEGAEIEALRGMARTIETARPAFLIEVHWLGEAFTEFVQEKMSPLGYRMTTYSGGEIPSGFVRYHALLVAGKIEQDHAPEDS